MVTIAWNAFAAEDPWYVVVYPKQTDLRMSDSDDTMDIVRTLSEAHFDEEQWAEMFGSDSDIQTVIVHITHPATFVGFYLVDLERVTKARCHQKMDDPRRKQ